MGKPLRCIPFKIRNKIRTSLSPQMFNTVLEILTNTIKKKVKGLEGKKSISPKYLEIKTPLNNPGIKKEIIKEIRKYSDLNNNEKIKSVGIYVKAVHRGKCVVLMPLLKRVKNQFI